MLTARRTDRRNISSTAVRIVKRNGGSNDGDGAVATAGTAVTTTGWLW
jgi:hypothetical protein